MSKNIKKVFSCSNCGAQFPKWSGRCLECGSWSTLTEDLVDKKDENKAILKNISGAEMVLLSEIKGDNITRFKVGIEEVDRVLGGGIVPGSLILLSGEPGIGKSTLTAQIASEAGKTLDIIYVSGEESAIQVKNRMDRLKVNLERLNFVSETSVEKIVATALKHKPNILIVDSIQTVYSSLIPSEAGNVSQIRAATVKFLELAKENNITVILIGHITKDGQVAGPKSLEHIVDTVLYLESETSNNYCFLRASKNRFGSVNELGVLEMTGFGFKEVKNPSAAFVDMPIANIPGSIISSVMEGSRAFLVDVQALVSKTVFGYPQRKASGFDLNRLTVLSAVLGKRTEMSLASQDIILNITGGLRVSDPALDLSVCAAIISSFYNKHISRDIIVLGEVGLGGELRPVSRLESRLKEAERLGIKLAIIPDSDIKSQKIKLKKIKNLNELIDIIK